LFNGDHLLLDYMSTETIELNVNALILIWLNILLEFVKLLIYH